MPDRSIIYNVSHTHTFFYRLVYTLFECLPSLSRSKRTVPGLFLKTAVLKTQSTV